jgi:hypothetical protein
MGFFSSAVSSVARLDSEPIKDLIKKTNFISACCELADREGYEILYLKHGQDPFKVGKINLIEDLMFVHLETLEEINYRLIVIGSTNYLSPLMQASKQIPVPLELINKNYCSPHVNYELLTSLGSISESSFDIYRRIELERYRLKSLQDKDTHHREQIKQFLKTTGIPELNKLPRSSDRRHFV